MSGGIEDESIRFTNGSIYGARTNGTAHTVLLTRNHDVSNSIARTISTAQKS